MLATNTIGDLLRSEDIEGLIASGAPADEYASEAREIASMLASLAESDLNEKVITDIISRIWAKSFNRSPEEIQQRTSAFRRIAQQLI